MRTIILSGISAVVLLSGYTLHADAHEFALSGGPGTGREKACYTILDTIMGATSPLTWTRDAQLQFGPIIMWSASAPALLALAFVVRDRQRLS